MGFFSKLAKERKESEIKPSKTARIIEDLFDDTEQWSVRMVGQLINYSGARFAEMDEEQMKIVNGCIDYWKYLRDTCIMWAEKNDREQQALIKNNEILKQQLENQRETLLEMRVMLREMKDSINDKEIEVKKGVKKAE